MKVHELADEVSRPSVAPGGGSIAALAGSLGASLGSMVANLTHAKKGMEEHREVMEKLALECQELKDDLMRAVDEDTAAFNDVIAASRLPKGTAAEKAAREAAIQAGYQHATEVPLLTANLCLATMRACKTAAELGNPASVTDAGVGALMARAGVIGAIDNVRINFPSITDENWVAERREQLAALRRECDEQEAEVRRIVERAFQT